MSESKAQWTPGPWKIGRYTTTSVVTESADRLVASTGGYQTNQEDPEALLTRQEADAHLIAAAPDLYAELEHLVMALEPIERTAGLGIPGVATLNGPRRALAKAWREEVPE